MKCIYCNGTNLKKTKTDFHPEIKDEIVCVSTEAWVCFDCGKAIMDSDQMDKFLSLCRGNKL